MNSTKGDLPKTGGEDWLTGIPDSAQIEEGLLSFLGVLQKYGVLVTICCVVIFYFLYRLSKIRKNQVFAKFWMTTAWGMVILTIIFIILPYVVLFFY